MTKKEGSVQNFPGIRALMLRSIPWRSKAVVCGAKPRRLRATSCTVDPARSPRSPHVDRILAAFPPQVVSSAYFQPFRLRGALRYLSNYSAAVRHYMKMLSQDYFPSNLLPLLSWDTANVVNILYSASQRCSRNSNVVDVRCFVRKLTGIMPSEWTLFCFTMFYSRFVAQCRTGA